MGDGVLHAIESLQTYKWLTDPQLASLLWPGLITGLAVSVVAAVLSPFVVLKRYAFVGQGVSHSAFGGIGVAAVLGLVGTGVAEGLLWYAIVMVFCLLAAVGMGLISDRKSVGADTAIGVFLVGSMALGAVLIAIRLRSNAGMVTGWESILFGQILTVSRLDQWTTVGIGIIVLAALAWWRRPLVFWAFDETASPAFGLSPMRMRLMLMVLLALTVVSAMKVVGVVLATALLVLPGATGLRLATSMRGVMLVSLGAAVVSLLAGFVLGFELHLPTGACIVLAMTGVFAASLAWSLGARRGLARA